MFLRLADAILGAVAMSVDRSIGAIAYQPIAFRNFAFLLRGNDAVKLRTVLERGLRFNPEDAQLRAMLP